MRRRRRLADRRNLLEDVSLDSHSMSLACCIPRPPPYPVKNNERLQSRSGTSLHTSLLSAVAATAAAVSATTASAIAASTGSTATAASTVGGFVDANSTSVKPENVSRVCGTCRSTANWRSNVHRRGSGGVWPMMGFTSVRMTYSSLFNAAIAESASASFAKRTKPKPLLRPVSRSLTTTCNGVSALMTAAAAEWITHGFLDLAKLLKLLAESAVVGVPCKASVKVESWTMYEEGEVLTQ
jgi:hypothetical protein